MKVDSIIKRMMRLPNWVNWMFLRLNVFGSWLYGRKYAAKRRELGRQFQDEQAFVDLMNRFISSTPFYSSQNVEVSSLSDFQQNLGTINKNTVLERFSEFLSSDYRTENYVEGSTGGTTGKPMRILMPKDRYGFELPVVHEFWRTYGWNFHTRAVLRNHQLKEGELYRINPLTKEVIFDAFRQDDDYIRFIHGLISRKNIQFVQAYPSSAYQFCKRCKELGLKTDGIKAFFTSSEPVHPFQRTFIFEELGIQLFNFFGHSEKLLIAGTCGETDLYHFEPSYGLAELLDAQGKQVESKGERAELVGTTYNNPGMPLLRFATGDTAEFVGRECPNCGKKALVVRAIIGHYNDNLVYTKTGYTTTTALNLHSELYQAIDGLQYIQNETGQLIVCIKPNGKYSDETTQKFLEHFNHAMGEDSSVELRITEQFVHLPNGKYPLLISNIKHEG